MRKPRIAIAAYDAMQTARTRWRAERAIRRMVPFDRLPPSVRDRVVVSRQKVLEGRSLVHHAPGATPVDQRLDTGELHLSVLRDVLVDVYFGFAQTRDGWILEETSAYPPGIEEKLRNGRLLRPTRIHRVDRPVMNLECGPQKTNFYHFWLESMTKLLWVDQPEVVALGPSILAHERELADWQRALLGAALPPHVELLQVDRDTLLDPPLYIDLPPYSGYSLDAEALIRLRSWSSELHRGSIAATVPTRVFVSRRRARWRRLLNEEASEALLHANGFTTVLLEELPVGDQIALFEQSDTIVAQHGAGLTHLIHARPGTRLLEIQSGSPGGEPLHYRGLAHSVNVDYANVFCHSNGPRGPKEDAEVPLDELRVWLDAHAGPAERS